MSLLPGSEDRVSMYTWVGMVPSVELEDVRDTAEDEEGNN